MPIYTYRCPACSTRRDIFKSLAFLDREEPCEACQTTMERQLSAPAIVADYAGYACPISGKWIEGRRAHEENLARHECRVLEGGETEQARRRGSQEAAILDKEVDNTVEQFYEALPTEKREALAVAVQSGLDVSIDRK